MRRSGRNLDDQEARREGGGNGLPEQKSDRTLAPRRSPEKLRAEGGKESSLTTQGRREGIGDPFRPGAGAIRREPGRCREVCVQC